MPDVNPTTEILKVGCVYQVRNSGDFYGIFGLEPLDTFTVLSPVVAGNTDPLISLQFRLEFKFRAATKHGVTVFCFSKHSGFYEYPGNYIKLIETVDDLEVLPEETQ
jgi:hypothetical protein